MRNVLSYTSSRHKAAMGEGLKRTFRADTAAEARARCTELAGAMEGKTGKAIECLENVIEDALAMMALPAKYRRRMKSSNMQERLIQELRRPERVIRI
jgi:transposase-like protein